ncbi:MAG TPA: class I SAM-dependent methyltransferase [Chitinophagaceae bacterium]|nr:class I SAM-dependent methyltransferase [Chitinophagaceae bacterium]
MQPQKNIIECYDRTAKNYADKYGDELSHKEFDRTLLTAFASVNRNKGKIIDLGCGPGQTTKYLADCGCKDVLGVDLSPEMVKVAKEINPQLDFETADMLKLPYPAKTFGAALAFYSIVHFDYPQINIAFQEIKRVLVNNGHFLFSFHVGDNSIHRDEFLDQPVNIDFYFFQPPKIIELLTATGFDLVDSLDRQHYPDVEYPSKRAYIWAKNKNW